MVNIESIVKNKCIEVAGLITRNGGDIAKFEFTKNSVAGIQIGMLVGIIFGMILKEDNILRRKFGMATPFITGVIGSVVGGVLGNMIPEHVMPMISPENLHQST